MSSLKDYLKNQSADQHNEVEELRAMLMKTTTLVLQFMDEIREQYDAQKNRSDLLEKLVDTNVRSIEFLEKSIRSK